MFSKPGQVRLYKLSTLSCISTCLVMGTPVLGAQQPVTIRYGDAAPDVQSMDVYWPSKHAAATVLFIHGGSLQESGERRSSPMYRNVCNAFVREDIACASMDYRLAPTHRWPSMPNDVALALRTLRDLVAKEKGDPSRIFLFGHSSGCHLAGIVGTNPQYLATVGLATKDIAGLVLMGCLLDRDDATVRRFTADRIRQPFMNEPQDVATYGTPENYLAANPASFVGPHVPPTLVLLAEEERFMPPVMEQGSRFVRLLLEHDVAANLVVVPGSHVSSIERINLAGDPALAAILAFISNSQPSAAANH